MHCSEVLLAYVLSSIVVWKHGVRSILEMPQHPYYRVFAPGKLECKIRLLFSDCNSFFYFLLRNLSFPKMDFDLGHHYFKECFRSRLVLDNIVSGHFASFRMCVKVNIRFVFFQHC